MTTYANMISDTMTKGNNAIKKKVYRRHCSIKKTIKPNTTLLDLNMRQRSTKLKILGVIQEILSLPSAKLFTFQSNEEMNKIIYNIEKNMYNQPRDIFNDINNIIEESGKKKENSAENTNVNIMANILKDRIKTITKSDHKDLKLKPVTSSSIICQLKKQLDQTITTNKEIDMSATYQHSKKTCSKTKVADASTMTTPFKEPEAKYYRFIPSRTHDFNRIHAKHAYIAGCQYYKMMARHPNNNTPIRKILDISHSIEAITYIDNFSNMSTYEACKTLFKIQGKVDSHGDVEELLLFHGTNWSCVANIAKTNFDINAIPQQQDKNKQTRKKSMMYGKAIYLSESPALSLMYGNALILCKVIPGNCEILRINNPVMPMHDCYDSREVLATNGESLIHAIRRKEQIQPYCIIHIKQNSLTSEFIPTANKT